MIWMVIGYVKTYLDKCKRDNIGAFAAQAAFFIIMSAIPFLMVFTSLITVHQYFTGICHGPAL